MTIWGIFMMGVIEPIIRIDAPKTYAIPISNLIGKRLNRIYTLNQRLKKYIAKLYNTDPTENTDELCEEIHTIITDIEKLLSKNIEDAQILEYAIVENTKYQEPSPTNFTDAVPNFESDHVYIQ